MIFIIFQGKGSGRLRKKRNLPGNPWKDCLWKLAVSRSDKASYRNVIFLTSTIRTYVK